MRLPEHLQLRGRAIMRNLPAPLLAIALGAATLALCAQNAVTSLITACDRNTIYILDAETGAEKAAIRTPYPYEARSPKLIPGTGLIAYIQKAGVTGKRQVFTISTDGGRPTQLTHMPHNCNTLDVSPDGRAIVFSHATARPRIWKVVIGQEPVPLTEDGRSALDGSQSWGDHWPAYGPDGRIAYYRVGKIGANISCDIYCMDASGRFLANLTDRIALEDFPGFSVLTGVTDITWSPDGRYVLFLLQHDDNGPKRDLFSIDLKNNHAVTNLTRNRPRLRSDSGPQSIYRFSICPPGDRLVYSPHTPSPGLMTVRFFGDRLGAPQPLTTNGVYRWPSCSRD